MDYKEAIALFEERLNGKGVFLTVSDGTRTNTMTISWGSAGVMWGKGIITVPVRNTRYTYELLQNADSFTISIPDTSEESNALLLLCGTKSGRDSDKMSALTLEKARTVNGAVVTNNALAHIECRIMQHADVNNGTLDPSVDEKIYPKKDYHTLYIGQIEAVYEQTYR